MKEHSRPCCVTLLLKDCYHKVDGPHYGLKIYTSPQSGRTPPWVKNLYKSTKWTDLVGIRLMQKRERTLQTFKTPINIMDGPNQFVKLYKSIMWTAIRGHDHIQRNERTRPGSQKIWRSTTWTDQIKQVLKHQDGAHTTIINAIVKEAFK